MANEPKREVELPQMGFVKGGTTTMAHDQMKAQQFADAERRRDMQAAKMRASETGELPKFLRGDDAPGDAKGMGKMSSLALGGKDFASIVLAIKHPKDNKIQDWITCELWPEGEELVLNLCCPRCIFSRGVKMGDAQIKIKQSNRMFWLDTKRQGEVWVNPNDPNEVVTIAGTITTNDWIGCPQCDLKFRIDDSVLHVK